MIQDIFPYRLDTAYALTGKLAAAEWHLRTGLPDELMNINIAYEMLEALRLKRENALRRNGERAHKPFFLFRKKLDSGGIRSNMLTRRFAFVPPLYRTNGEKL